MTVVATVGPDIAAGRRHGSRRARKRSRSTRTSRCAARASPSSSTCSSFHCRKRARTRSRGRLTHRDSDWRYEKFAGRIGNSDVAGSLRFTEGPDRPRVQGELTFKTLDLADLGPVVGRTGMPRERLPALRGRRLPSSRAGLPSLRGTYIACAAGAPVQARSLDESRCGRQGESTDDSAPAGVAARAAHDASSMRESVLTLDPLDFGAAGGDLAGRSHSTGSRNRSGRMPSWPSASCSLAKLLPTVPRAEKSVGRIDGAIELVGRGDSVARMLATADGKVGLIVEGGKISKRLMEQIALQLPEIVLRQVSERRAHRHPLRGRRLRRRTWRHAGKDAGARHRCRQRSPGAAASTLRRKR